MQSVELLQWVNIGRERPWLYDMHRYSVCWNVAVVVVVLLTCIGFHGRWLIGGLVFGLCRLHFQKEVCGVEREEKSQPCFVELGAVNKKPTTTMQTPPAPPSISQQQHAIENIMYIMRDVVVARAVLNKRQWPDLWCLSLSGKHTYILHYTMPSTIQVDGCRIGIHPFFDNEFYQVYLLIWMILM